MTDHIVQRLYDLAARSPDTPALTARGPDGAWTTRTLGELAATVRRLSNALISERLLPSETAVVMGPQGPAWFIGHLSILAAGGVSVPVDEASSDEEISAIIRETEARFVLVCGRTARSTVDRIRRRLPGLRLVVPLDAAAEGPGDDTRRTRHPDDPWGVAGRAAGLDDRDGYHHDVDDHDVDLAEAGAGVWSDGDSGPTDGFGRPAAHLDRGGHEPAEGPAVVPLSRLEQLPYDLATAAEAHRRAEAWSGDDVAAVHYVASPSGSLRGVVLTHGSTLYPVDCFPRSLTVAPPPTFVLSAPLTQAMHYWAALTVLLGGGTVWCPAPEEDLAEVLREVGPSLVVETVHTMESLVGAALDDAYGRLALSEELVAWAVRVADEVDALRAAGRTVPPHLAFQRRGGEVRVFGPIRARLGGPKRVTVLGGHSPASPELMSLLRHLGQSPATTWGALETAGVCTFAAPGTEPEGSVGRPLPGTEIRIDEAGCLAVRGPGVMRGYYGRPEDTREALVDGWYRSRQPARLGDDGRVYLTSRVDDVIVTASLRYVSARPIERALEEQPLVAGAVVVGESRRVLTALVQPDVAALRESLRAAPGPAPVPDDDAALLGDPRAVRLVGDVVRRTNAALPEHQRVAAFRLIATPFGTESVGASMTRRERALQDHADVIESMYADLDGDRARRKG